MTNLDAFCQAFGWNGGTYTQVDLVITKALKQSGLRSITELNSMDDWIDLLIAATAVDCCVHEIKKAYLTKFRSIA